MHFRGKPRSPARILLRVLILSPLLFLLFHSQQTFLLLQTKQATGFTTKPNTSRPSRFTEPPIWHDLSTENPYGEPPTISQARNRVFLSNLPRESADGLGHRFGMANYDMVIALYLGVTYIHRRPRYGSLSPDHDPMAAERLLGFISVNDTRESFLKQHCLEEKSEEQILDECKKRKELLIFCEKLRPESPFKHLVQVPSKLADCVSGNRRKAYKCGSALRDFAEKHNKSSTVFFVEPSPKWCAIQQVSNDFSATGSWIRRNYWNYHRHTTVLTRNESAMNGQSITRALPFEEGRLQIAVHIRRGDFFNYSRTIVPDYAFADVIAAAKRAADLEYRRNVPTTVSIFSEGVAKPASKVLSMHNMDKMDPIYLTEKAEKIYNPDAHWSKLIKTRLKSTSNVDVRAYIASDTVTAIHSMICADIFVASRSALSQNIVEVLARGFVLTPAEKGVAPPRAPENSLRLRYGFNRIGKGEVYHDELKRGVRGVLHEVPWDKRGKAEQ